MDVVHQILRREHDLPMIFFGIGSSMSTSEARLALQPTMRKSDQEIYLACPQVYHELHATMPLKNSDHSRFAALRQN